MEYFTQSNFAPMEPLNEGTYEGFEIVENVNTVDYVMVNQINTAGIDDIDMEYVNATYFMRIANVTNSIEAFLASDIAELVLEKIKHGIIPECQVAEPTHYRVSNLDVDRNGMFIVQAEFLPEYAKGVYMHPDLFHAFVIWNGRPNDILAIVNAMIF